MYTPGFDVIMMALPRWDGLYSSTAYSLASAMSKHVRVFYIDNPFTLKDYITQYNSKQIVTRKKALLHGKNIFVRPEKDNQNLVVVTPRLTLPVNWLPSGIIYDSLARVNDAIVYDAIDATLQAYNSTRYVFINSFNPLFGRFFSNRFSPLLNIYHCVDDISKSLYISKHGTSLEITAVKNADFSIVTSRELQRLKSAQTSKPVYYLPNAANVELFQQAAFNELPAPSEISALPKERKVILYMGNICHRLDYTLLKAIAQNFPEHILLMVGPVSSEGIRKNGLDQLPNVILTGSRKLDQLPAYVKYSHCCIIPFLCNTLTRSIYPLKINEYLSAGKPVVTTAFSEDITTFKEVAYISSDYDQFLANIKLALAEDDGMKASMRIAFSASNNWEARANQLIRIIESHLEQQPLPTRGRPEEVKA